jgi:hypothetical protein
MWARLECRVYQSTEHDSKHFIFLQHYVQHSYNIFLQACACGGTRGRIFRVYKHY